jgi:hypothetical protein
MPGRVDEYVSISKEEKAEHVASALKDALTLEQTEDNMDRIYRNARHLQIVIDTLDITPAKRAEYQNLITRYLID